MLGQSASQPASQTRAGFAENNKEEEEEGLARLNSPQPAQASLPLLGRAFHIWRGARASPHPSPKKQRRKTPEVCDHLFAPFNLCRVET